MSFGRSNDAKRAENNLGGISSQATNQLFPAAMDLSKNSVAQGNNLFSLGTNTLNKGAVGAGNVNTGTGFLNTIMNGNRANTTSLLAPQINQIRQNSTAAMTAANTLMPRGGGRSGTLFAQSFAPQAQIGNLFSSARMSAPGTLASIGLQQQGLTNQLASSLFGTGANLFGIGNSSLGTGASALNAGTGASTALAEEALRQQQMRANAWSSLGSGIFNLATMPLGNLSNTPIGKIGGLFSRGGN